MSIRVVTVFGGTGFLGHRVVRHLRKHEFSVRIASRHPDRSRKLFGSDDPYLRSVEVDTRDERMVADVLAGAYAAVNAVSLYVERGQETFHSVHVEAAERVAVVAEAIARALQRTQTHAMTFECGGPCVYSYGELLRALARKADLQGGQEPTQDPCVGLQGGARPGQAVLQPVREKDVKLGALARSGARFSATFRARHGSA